MGTFGKLFEFMTTDMPEYDEDHTPLRSGSKTLDGIINALFRPGKKRGYYNTPTGPVKKVIDAEFRIKNAN